jgi:cobalt-precorrin 5A hydrolase
MGLGESVIAAGVGCRKAISAAQVESAIAAALLLNRLAGNQLDVLAVPAVKGTEAGIVAAAAARGILLVLIEQDALEAAEAAALAAAGPGSRLLAPRLAVGPVTCALARGETPP